MENNCLFSLSLHIMVCSLGTPYALLRDYAEENLQAQDKEIRNSYWFGNGAQKLNLPNCVLPKEYQNLYLGQDKQGQPLKQQQRNKGHTSGRDLTFSAPKSVSILCLVEGKKELLEVHKQAINKTLSYIEQNCIFTRLGKGGRNKEQTNNLVAAVFQHRQSRNHDPNLHSHCVIFNLTQGQDSKWRTMDNRELYAQKMTLGMIYRHHLAQRLQEMGYSLNWNRDGTFDLANYSKEQIELFSSRRTEIINFAGIESSTQEKARACIATRNIKQYINALQQKEIESGWKTKLHSVDFSTTAPKHSIAKHKMSQTAKQIINDNRQLEPNLIDDAIAKIRANNTKTRFSEHELLKYALIEAKGNYDIKRIGQAIHTHPDLIPTEDKKLTTTQLLKQEKSQQQTTSPQTKIANKVKAIFKTQHQHESLALPFSDELQFHTHPDQKERINSAISQYLRENSPHKLTLIVDTEKDKQELSQQVRKKLIQEKTLTNNALTTVVLQPKHLSQEEKINPRNYHPGDAIKFSRNSKYLISDRIYKVIGVDVKNKILTLRDREKKEITFPIKRYQNRSLFKVEKRELRENELLRFSRNQYVNGNQVYAGQLCTVKEIKDPTQITIKIKGKQSIVNADRLFFTEYGYAATLKNYQSYPGQLKNCVYYPTDSKSLELFQQDLFTVAALSKNSLSVYVGNNNYFRQFSTTANRTDFKMDDLTRDNSLFEIASSAKYLVNTNNQSDKNQVLTVDESTAIKQSQEGLIIKDRGKELRFDRDLRVEKNELSDKQIKELSQKFKKDKEKSIQENRTKEINRNVGLSL